MKNRLLQNTIDFITNKARVQVTRKKQYHFCACMHKMISARTLLVFVPHDISDFRPKNLAAFFRESCPILYYTALRI